MKIIYEPLRAPINAIEERMEKMLLRMLIILSILIAQNAFADCSRSTLNKSDEIYEGYLCRLISKEGVKDVKDLCIIRARTTNDPDQVYKYTQMKTLVIGESGTKSSFLTFKWHHKKNSSTSKMKETGSKIKMKDVTAVDFMASNIYKVAEFDKRNHLLSIAAYKKKAVIGLKKYKSYSADFKCEKID
jgi:hypothetical protein